MSDGVDADAGASGNLSDTKWLLAHGDSSHYPIATTWSAAGRGVVHLTEARCAPIIPGCSPLLRRAVIALALCLVVGPVMPQEHVHDADDAHAHAVAHSHVEFPSARWRPAAFYIRDHDVPEIAADDERVVGWPVPA